MNFLIFYDIYSLFLNDCFILYCSNTDGLFKLGLALVPDRPQSVCKFFSHFFAIAKMKIFFENGNFCAFLFKFLWQNIKAAKFRSFRYVKPDFDRKFVARRARIWSPTANRIRRGKKTIVPILETWFASNFNFHGRLHDLISRLIWNLDEEKHYMHFSSLLLMVFWCQNQQIVTKFFWSYLYVIFVARLGSLAGRQGGGEQLAIH